MSIKKNTIIEELGKKPLMVVGIVKNIEKTLIHDIENLSNALEFFREIHWFLVESESTDNSIAVLEKIKQNYKNFDYKTISTSFVGETRTEKMATARNAYLEYLRKQISDIDFPYTVIADFNLLNNKITKAGILSSWIRSDWDVVTANQSGRYYDVWALRHPLWSPNDCWEQHSFIRRYVRFPESAITFSIRSRMLKIPKNSEWIRVDSSFGGFVIYKTEYLLMESRYEGLGENRKEICEHVTFHKQLIKQGARIFINPSLINTKYTDHSRRMTFVFTSLRFFKNSKKLIRKSI